VVDLLHTNDIRVLLATATASPPPWFSRLYPESLPVDKDGLRYKHGSRQHYCPNSRAYSEASAELAGMMAQRYGQHPAVLMWHVNNEYACHISECYCDVCRDEFRHWLQNRYGTLEALNDSWGTAFWSQRYGAWEDIELPNRTTSFRNPGQVLDYKRFMNASILNLFCGEISAIRAAGAQQSTFTNMVFGLTALDQFEWAKYADYTAIDMYPDPSLGNDAWCSTAFAYDVIRSAKLNKPFLLLEQATTQVNWRPINQLKPPGMMRALSYQAVARGSNSVMFFQWRASKSGAEKYHSAMVPHFGTEHSRLFEEVSRLGAELKRLQPILDTCYEAQVGLLFSFENLWALEIDSKPAQIDAAASILPWYDAFLQQNIPINIVHPDSDLSSYRVLIAPLLYQITKEQTETLQAFVQQGGTLIMTYFSGITDGREHIQLGGYLGLLQDVLGLRVEEWQPLMPTEITHFADSADQMAAAEHWVDLLHPTTAQTIARYVDSFFAGRVAITRNAYGKGHAFYVGTRPEASYLQALLRTICAESGVMPLLEANSGVEASLRTHASARYLFVINQTNEPKSVTTSVQNGIDCLTGEIVAAKFVLPPYAVRIIHLTL
jgi:beta-galactosidase